MAELTPAEKAELRRQKILAKKKARMAFVVEGDRSQLPSSDPGTGTLSSATTATTNTTITTTTTTTTTTTSLPGGEALAKPLSSATLVDESSNSQQEAFDDTTDAVYSSSANNVPPHSSRSRTSLSSQSHSHSNSHSYSQSELQSQSNSSFSPFQPPPPPVVEQQPLSPRLQSILLLARVLLLVCVAAGTTFAWPSVSAVEAFVCLRVVLALPALLRPRQQPSQSYGPPKRWTWLDLATRLPSAYLTAQSVWHEFAVYVTVALLTVSLKQATS